MPFSEFAIKISEAREKTSSETAVNECLDILDANKRPWVRMNIRDRIELIDTLIADFDTIAEAWVRASLNAKGADDVAAEAQEWLGGPFSIIRNLQLLKTTLHSIQTGGTPRLPAKPHSRPDGQVVAQVFPTNLYDKMLFMGTTGEIWMDPDLDIGELKDATAVAYQEDPQPEISLVLGAGNVSSIGPMDCFYKLFVEKKVCMLKLHPVNAYLGPLIEWGCRALMKQGFLKVAYGGTEIGSYLCNHDKIDEIHITGSDKTHDAIVFGPDVETNKDARKPQLTKNISSELGNVSPWIVVPGDWSEDDLAFQAENVISSLVNNAGFNCNATRVIVTHQDWPQRTAFLDAIRKGIRRLDTRKAYYPGAQDRFDAILKEHPEAEQFGVRSNGHLPWTLITGLDPEAEDLCYNMEAFCGLFTETAIPGTDTPEFIANSVNFANRRLWGTLNATLIVHPQTMESESVKKAFEQAVADLRYGAVSVNHWAAIAYAAVSTSWGAFPGHDLYDIQSGRDVVHNTYMFSRVQKSVMYGPFKPWPKPAWFYSHTKSHKIARKLTRFQASPNPLKLVSLFSDALTG